MKGAMVALTMKPSDCSHRIAAAASPAAKVTVSYMPITARSMTSTGGSSGGPTLPSTAESEAAASRPGGKQLLAPGQYSRGC
jgi:hypothetical protein